jgi:mannose-1-phosphate guanylyltransferase
VAHEPSRLVLLAIEAHQPESEYGYVVPRADDGEFNLWGTRRALKFVEKPNSAIARELIRAGGLWNTMIMVFKVRTLVETMQRLFPTTFLNFARILDAIGTPEEAPALDSVYQTLEPMNFSKGVLEKIAATNPAAISVLPVLQVFWSDWGSPERLLQAQETLPKPEPMPKPAVANQKQKRPSLDPSLWQGEFA